MDEFPAIDNFRDFKQMLCTQTALKTAMAIVRESTMVKVCTTSCICDRVYLYTEDVYYLDLVIFLTQIDNHCISWLEHLLSISSKKGHNRMHHLLLPKGHSKFSLIVKQYLLTSVLVAALEMDGG